MEPNRQDLLSLYETMALIRRAEERLSRLAPISGEMILNTIAVHDLGMPRSY